MLSADSPIPLRFCSQRLIRADMDDVVAVVRWMGALQAQEEHHAKAAIGLRLRDGTLGMIDTAIDERRIVRTWIMRGTLHFVAADDLWWMQQLLAEGVMRKAAGNFLLGGLDPQTLARANVVLKAALEGAGPLLRTELVERLTAAGIDMKGPLSSRILCNAAYAGLVCMGPTRGKQETFVWLEDWVPRPAPIVRETAIQQLALQYFRSHGPASLDDFVAWSGLGIREARAGMAALPLEQFGAGAPPLYWLPQPSTGLGEGIHLLPGFDELLIGYRDRSWLLDPALQGQVITNNGIFRPLVVVDGRALGLWQRKVMKDRIVVDLQWLDRRPSVDVQVLEAALRRLERIWEMPVVLGTW